MSRIFRGSVSIYLNTKGEIALKRDVDGKFSAENVAECHKTMLELAKKHKAVIHKWSYWVPEGTNMKTAEPVLIADRRYGSPKIVMMAPVTTVKASDSRKRVVKLA